jgi:hypothetical protein
MGIPIKSPLLPYIGYSATFLREDKEKVKVAKNTLKW